VFLTVTLTKRLNQPNYYGNAYLVAPPYTALPLRLTYIMSTILFNVGKAHEASTAYELVYAECSSR